jgi:hypothetical protein
MKNLKKGIFPFIIAFSALSVSASAAFYSISGLSKLFAGASFEVIVMASSLEIAKLVIASLLYQYWNEINKALRTYLTIACGVLILITSMGIYGFLSAAYQETANKSSNLDVQISLVETKRDNIKKQLDVYNLEKENTDKAIAGLRNGLSNNVISYTDKNGNVVTSTSSATRKALEKQLDQAILRQTDLNEKVDDLNAELFKYESEIVEIKTGSDLAGELGPLKYLSGLTGTPMDKIINILLLVIIFVFDPLAISLVVAANFAFEKAFPKKRENLYGELVDDFSEWDDLDEEETTPRPSKEEIEKMENTRDAILEKSTLYKTMDNLYPETVKKYEDLPIKVAGEEKDIKDIEVKEPEEVSTKEEFLGELDRLAEFKQNQFKKVRRILQKSPSKLRVEFTDGTSGWIDKSDLNENPTKKIY